MLFKLWSPHEMAGGGGGTGEPLTRPFEKVLKDIRNGLVSVEIPKRGVVVAPMFFNADEEGIEEREEIN
jgi:N-methylhydantoinase B/oxoprolinase/acetone carboxylase alpha subunit